MANWPQTLEVRVFSPGRLWRQLATGCCFVAYGGLGWLAGLVVLPLLLLWPGTGEARRMRISHFMSWSYRALLAAITVLRIGDVEVHGRRRLAGGRGRLIVANHPMYLDALVLMGLLPEARCVVKQAMRGNPFFRRFVRTVGYVGNADAVELIHDCVAALERGETLIVFPEGTRSVPGQPLRFPRGAAQIAVRSGCEVVPVVIDCTPLVLGKGQRWYHVAERPWRLRLRVGAPRALADWGVDAALPYGVAARRLTRRMQAHFRAELEQGVDAEGRHA